MAASSTRNCSSSSDYCRTKLTITDGVVNAVSRSCQSNASDHDIHSNAVPSVTTCTTVLDFKGNPTAKTECYFPCKGDKCSNVTIVSLKKCNSSCNNGNSGGSCDYISGKCVCNSGHYGEHCNLTKLAGAKRKCVQCTSASGMNCSNFAEANDCPDNKAFCSTTNTSLIDSSNKVVLTIVTKGCTQSPGVADECFFTDTFTDTPINNGGLYKEFTCVSTCDTDGCNKVVADGQKYTGKSAPKQCVICNDLTGSTQCNPGKTNVQTRSACPGSNLCNMSVTYLVSERTDLPYTSEPSYTLRSVTRGCASAAKDGYPVNKPRFLDIEVTITETCDVDGCNDKWPERPKCVQCESELDTNGFDSCLLNPPPPTACTYPYHKYCYIQDNGMTHNDITSIHGYRRSIKRGCSATILPNGCSTHTNFRGVKVDSCNMTCEEDECNVEPSYTLRSVTRGCASAAEDGYPVNKPRSLDIEVTITETCDVDGCNDKWPERPKCVQCESKLDTNGFDSCLLNPPPPTACTYPYHKYCYIQDNGMTHNDITSIHGYRRSIKRGCSATILPNGCSTHTNFRGVKVDSCNMTCEEDGCNVGFGRVMNNAGVIATHYTSAVVLFAIIGSLGNV
ncbi:uncharacterized protein LOC144430780 [Styela clava]